MAKPKTRQPQARKDQPAGLRWNHPALAIFLFAFLLYSGTLNHDFVMDDGAVITNHETVRKGIAGIPELFSQSSVFGSTKENFGTYRPFTMSWFAFQWSLFGDQPFGYHFLHVLLYSFLCLLVFIVLHRLLREMPHGTLTAFVSALLFAAHPLHTEVGANIKSADEILSLLFGLTAFYTALRFITSGKSKELIFSGLSLLAGLFSKESAATFMVLVPLGLFIFSKTEKKILFRLFSIYGAAIFVYFLSRSAALDPAPPVTSVFNNALAGASGFSERYGTALVILLKYIQLLFFPHPLVWDYGFNQIPLVPLFASKAIIALLLLAGLAGWAIFLLRSPRGDSGKIISYGILFFLISISVSSNLFILIGSTMAERFLFTPSLGFVMILGWFIARSAPGPAIRDNSTDLPSLIKGLAPAKIGVLALLLLAGSWKTWMRNADWASNLILFQKGVQDSPLSYRTNTTYAWESVLAGEKETDPELKKKHFQNAVDHYNKGLAIYDKVENDWYNYGVSNSNLGKIDEAVSAYHRAIQLNPNHRNSLYNLATVYLSRKDMANALEYFRRVYQVEPDFMDVAFKTGVILHMGGDARNAVPYYERYYRNHPESRDVVNNLSMAYRAIGDTAQANAFQAKLQSMN